MHTVRFTEVAARGDRTVVTGGGGESLSADAVVICTGAWLADLIRRWVRVPVRAGRGYSFTVPVDRAVTGPVYLPTARVACTPYRGALRVAGTVEFRGPDDRVDPDRVAAIVAAAGGACSTGCGGRIARTSGADRVPFRLTTGP